MKFLTATKTLQYFLLLLVSLTSGCAAFRPIDGVPARYLAPELRTKSNRNASTIDLSLLAQKPPRQHHVDGGDVLGIYIEGVLGNPGEPPPIDIPTSPDLPPSIGYPISVRDDGTLSLPMIGSINVRGMTIRQVEDHLRRIYTTERKILKEGADRIIVSLQRPRQVRILVLRQEAGGAGGTQFAQGLSLNLGQTKRGNGQVVHLPIYKNDVLHALARTGGLPGLDAENTIYIVRREFSNDPPGEQPQPTIPPMPQPATSFVPAGFQQPYQTTAGQYSAHPDQNDSGIQLVGYTDSATSVPVVQQAVIYNPAGQFQNSAYGDNYYQSSNFQNPIGSQNPFGSQFSSRCTIEPVIAKNVGNSNPLDELRAGMYPTAVPLQEVSLRSHPENVYQQTAMQQQAPLQRLPRVQFAQAPYPQPSFSDPALRPHPTAVQYPPQRAQQMNESHTERPLDASQACETCPNENGYDQSVNQGDLWAEAAMEMSRLDNDPTMNNQKVVKIPIRLKPGESPNFTQEDVILQEGDILFIESRETEIFYTGGLLGGGQYTLPRDYDVDVLEAIAIAQGTSQQQASGQIGGVSAVNGDVTISASSVVILRRTPDGAQVPIKVDLYRALTDPSERILIQPGDMVMLRYKMHEAIGAFFERRILESAVFGIAASQIGGNGN